MDIFNCQLQVKFLRKPSIKYANEIKELDSLIFSEEVAELVGFNPQASRQNSKLAFLVCSCRLFVKQEESRFVTEINLP